MLDNITFEAGNIHDEQPPCNTMDGCTNVQIKEDFIMIGIISKCKVLMCSRKPRKL